MRREWHGRCHRCGTKTTVHTMSRFNTDLLCDDCNTKERSHPQYRQACEAEERAVRGGNYNFSGVGKPADL